MMRKVNSTGEAPTDTTHAASGNASPDWIPPSPPILSSAERGWRDIEAIRYKAQHDEMSVPAFSSHVVTVHLGQSPVNLVERLDDQVYQARSHRGQVALLPAGLPSEWHFKGPVDTEILHLYLDATFTRRVVESLEVEPNGVEIVNRLAVSDPQIERLGLLLNAELETGGDLLGSGLYAESLANALAICLLRHHSSLGKNAAKKVMRQEEEYVNGLSRQSLREAVDYINDNLAKRLTLAEIAGVAHLSPYHFSHLFKKSTGLSPYQYVLHRRVQRAKDLLVSTTLPLAEIALSSGFSSQSHLSRHFKRLVGISPKAFR